MIQRFFLLFVFLHLSGRLLAHSPSEMTYAFDFEKSKPELSIHTSLQGIILLLEPKIKSQSIVNVSSHTKELEEYFNKTIVLKDDKKNLSHLVLQLDKEKLQGHDSVLNFSIENLSGDIKELEINITSFLELLNHVKNWVEVKTPENSDSEAKRILFTEQKTKDTIAVKKSFDQKYLPLLIALVVIKAIVGFYIQNKRDKNKG